MPPSLLWSSISSSELIAIVYNKVIKSTSEHNVVSEFVYRNASIMHPFLKLAPSFGRKMYIRTSLWWKKIKKLPYRISVHTATFKLRSDTHMTSTLRESGRVRQKWDVIGWRREGEGVSECFEQPIFAFFNKKTGFAPWPDIKLSQTIYYWLEVFLLTLTSDSESII